MLFITYLTLSNWNISNQNVFLYDFWRFLSGEVYNVRGLKACLNSQFSRWSVVAVLAGPVFWELDLCKIDAWALAQTVYAFIFVKE